MGEGSPVPEESEALTFRRVQALQEHIRPLSRTQVWEIVVHLAVCAVLACTVLLRFLAPFSVNLQIQIQEM